MPRVSSALVDVWKDRALTAEARYDALLEKYHALKLAGAAAPKAQAIPAPILPTPDPEQRALEAAEEEFMARAVEDFTKAGKSESEAREIADHIRRSITATDSPVPFGL